MFGATRTLSRFASRSNTTWTQREKQWKVNGLLVVAGAAGVSVVVNSETETSGESHSHSKHTSTQCNSNSNNKHTNHAHALFHGLSLSTSMGRTLCEAAALDHAHHHEQQEEPINEEEEKFLDTLALYRRWFDDIRKQWDISKPASTQWPNNIPQKEEVSALELDLQLYLKANQKHTRRCQDLQFRIASYYLFREKTIEQQKKGFQMVKELAIDGHPDGLCLYATVWSHGNIAGVEAQPHLAVKYWRQAADMGHLTSLYEVGVALYMGEGTVENPAQAVQYFRKAADLGHSGAAFLLADCYLDGVGVQRDRGKAFEWLMTAAEMGHRQAQRRGEALLLGMPTDPSASSSTSSSTSAMTKLEQEESIRWECSPPSDWYRKVSLERRFSIGGGSRNPTILFRRKTKVAESRRSED